MSNKILVIATTVNCYSIHTPEIIKKHYREITKLLTKPLPLIYCFISRDTIVFRFDRGNGEDVRYKIQDNRILDNPDYVDRDRRADPRMFPSRYIDIQKLPRNYRKSL